MTHIHSRIAITTTRDTTAMINAAVESLLLLISILRISSSLFGLIALLLALAIHWLNEFMIFPFCYFS